MNKKIIFILLLIVLTIDSCRKSDYIPAPKIDLGKTSTEMGYITTPVLNNSNSFTFEVKVTPGAKYSFQVTDIKGDVIKSQGLTADQEIEFVTLDVSKITSGVYDLIFIDTKGNELKYPIVIK